MCRNRSKRRQLSNFQFEISIGCYCLLVCLCLIAVWLIHVIFYVIRCALSAYIDEGIGVEVYGAVSRASSFTLSRRNSSCFIRDCDLAVTAEAW